MSHASRFDRRWTRALTVCAVFFGMSLGIVAARQIANAPASPATGHAQVVTQGIAELPDEQMVWRVVERTAQPRWEAKAGRRVLGFVLASDEPILLTRVLDDGSTEDLARLGPGEALLIPEGSRQIRASMSDQPVTYFSLEFVPSSDADEIGNGTLLYLSDAIAAPTGARDVDLVRNVLALDEIAIVPDSGHQSYVLATDGAIDVLPGSGQRLTLQPGESGIFSGELTIRAVQPAAVNGAVAASRLTASLQQGGEGGSAYVVAVIGEEIGPVQTPTPVLPTSTSTPLPPPPTEVPPVEVAPTTPPEPTEVVIAEPSVAPNPDSDADGIPDIEEPQFGTSPRLPDTDGDGLLDGDEVFGYGTNPLQADTDQDALTDRDEVLVHGTDPWNPDTDGDQMSDGREVIAGRDPLDPQR